MMGKRVAAFLLAGIIAAPPLAASAKGGAGGHASASGGGGGGHSASPGTMVESGAAKSSGNTNPVNASAKPDENTAAKAKPSKKK